MPHSLATKWPLFVATAGSFGMTSFLCLCEAWMLKQSPLLGGIQGGVMLKVQEGDCHISG
ncbi:MAG: hypothetical protein P8Y60_15180 [Calditrichota bacterium]